VLLKIKTNGVSDIAFVVHAVVVGVIVELQLTVDTGRQIAAEGDAVGGGSIIQLVPLSGQNVISTDTAMIASAMS
jgi:hypothetical protein